MPKFKLEIDMSNDSFEDPESELYRILRAAAQVAREGLAYDQRHPLRDDNGSRVGYMVIEADPVWPTITLEDE